VFTRPRLVNTHLRGQGYSSAVLKVDRREMHSDGAYIGEQALVRGLFGGCSLLVLSTAPGCLSSKVKSVECASRSGVVGEFKESIKVVQGQSPKSIKGPKVQGNSGE
jgi:hypothetical protein